METDVSSSTDRYKGRPFLRFLECYVLWAIGELSDQDAARLDLIAAEQRRIHGYEGTWQEIVARQMDFPEGLRDALASMWERNLTRARQAGEHLDPEPWAAEVVDRKLI